MISQHRSQPACSTFCSKTDVHTKISYAVVFQGVKCTKEIVVFTLKRQRAGLMICPRQSLRETKPPAQNCHWSGLPLPPLAATRPTWFQAENQFHHHHLVSFTNTNSRARLRYCLHGVGRQSHLPGSNRYRIVRESGHMAAMNLFPDLQQRCQHYWTASCVSTSFDTSQSVWSTHVRHCVRWR